MKARRFGMRFSVVCLVTVILLAGLVGACAEPAPTPAPSTPTPAPSTPTPAPSAPTPAPSAPTPAPSAPTPAPSAPTPAPSAPTPAPSAPTPAPAPEVIELVVNDHNPPGSGPSTALAYWAEQVELQSGGRLKLTIQPGGALLSGAEAFRGTQTGICDVAMYVVDALDGFQLNLITALPFLGWPEQHVEDEYLALLNTFPEMQAEWQDITLVSLMMMPVTHLHTTDKAVKYPGHMKNMKIMGAEHMVNTAIEAAGATPIQLDIGEMATSLQTGLINGVVNHFPVLMIFGALELAPYHTVFGDGGINMNLATIIMNTAVLKSLPDDLQKIIVDSRPIYTEKFSELTNEEIAAALQFCEDNNHTMTRLSPEEIQVWYDLVKGPVHDEWIAECEAQGLPGQAVYDEALRLIAESQ